MNLETLRGAEGTLLDGGRFNIDRTRMFMPTSLGIACYRGSRNSSNEWNGTYVGIASSEEEAMRFLDGAYVELSFTDNDRY